VLAGASLAGTAVAASTASTAGTVVAAASRGAVEATASEASVATAASPGGMAAAAAAALTGASGAAAAAASVPVVLAAARSDGVAEGPALWARRAIRAAQQLPKGLWQPVLQCDEVVPHQPLQVDKTWQVQWPQQGNEASGVVHTCHA
jgi:hypothetical protein